MADVDTQKTNHPVQPLIDILEHPEDRIVPLLLKSNNPQDREAREKTKSELLEVVKYLFKGIEENARKCHEVLHSRSEGEEPVDIPPLSGLDELYVPETRANDGDDDDEMQLDVETLWGQVELQNNALNKLLKKSIKRLGKAPEKIVVLDMDQLASSDEEDAGEGSSDDDNDDQSAGKGMADGSDESDEDEDTKRIRARMERAMDDAGSDDDEEEEDSSDEEPEKKMPATKSSEEKKEELYDPVAEDMRDGFFDLNEMEDFADEEEEYLPREAYGQTEDEKKKAAKQQEKKKKSFHQMQRDGDLLNRSDDDDDEEGLEELYEEDPTPVKRKKYRDDEDIEALYSLYQNGNEDDSEAEDAANMTAAEFFGQPSKKYIERYNAKTAKEEVKGDDDSWGEYDFEEANQNEDRKAGWGDQSNGSENEDDGDDDGSDQEDEEAEKPADFGKKKKPDDSRHAKQQEKLRKQTEQLESEMMAEKPWQMTGETKSTSRPVNSLLDATPEFEMASKQAPTITIEHTENLEEVIKKRIIAEDWDDVVPRELPDVGWHKKRGELPEVSQEKSKLGLGELYEREYLKKAVGYDKDAEEKKTEEDKAKDEMKALFANLCSKLDGLSNYHFAPRPIADEAEVRTASAPAIAMEEVLPLHVNDARVVAPEEVYATKRGREGILRGESEMDQQERKRLRQSKKTARRKARKEKQADEKLISRLEPGLGLNNPYEKRKMREELATARSRGRVSTGEKDVDVKYGSSGTFFQRLQAETQQSLRGQAKGQDDDERKKKSKPKSSALKL